MQRTWEKRTRSPIHKSGASAGGAAVPTHAAAFTLPWPRILKLSFMYLFFCYPGVTLKLLRVFKCQTVEGVPYLAVDLRLQCYTAQWAGIAIYAAVMLIVYTIGLPVAVFLVLWHRRHKLFGPVSARTRASWGFLYECYGEHAWCWEVVELVRKVLLTSFVVLLNAHSPLQVTLATLISFWAHSLHALYAPWTYGSSTYLLQHLSLLATSFVFLMGLLFKSDRFSPTSVTGTVLSVAMLVFVAAFVIAWLATVIGQMAVQWSAGAGNAAVLKEQARGNVRVARVMSAFGPRVKHDLERLAALNGGILVPEQAVSTAAVDEEIQQPKTRRARIAANAPSLLVEKVRAVRVALAVAGSMSKEANSAAK
jgi:hypothetical protein